VEEAAHPGLAMSRRRRSGRAVLAAVALTVGSLDASAMAAQAPLITHARLAQAGDAAVLDAAFARRVPARALSARGGGRLCLQVTDASRLRHDACLTRRGSAWRVTVDRVAAAGRVRWRRARLRLQFTLRLPPGVVRWALSLRVADCTARCVARLPAHGTRRVRWSPRPPWACGSVATQSARERSVALTFDDGPSAYTGPLLAELEALHAPATFFVIGRQVPASARLLARMVADGDVVGNQTWDHVDVSRDGRQAARQIERTNAVIAAETGVWPCLFRPPYGSTSPALDAQVKALGMWMVLWSVDPTDWALPGTATIVGRVLAAVRPGAIVLLHDGGGPREQTLAAVPEIIDALRARGYRLVTVPALLVE
jgi:peptidoglycan/xylan/chitin deacetylase (PgdA/CDA1 family)